MPSQERPAEKSARPDAVDTAGPDTFPKLLLRHASERGGRPALREKYRGIWRTTTWRGLADEVSALAAALSERGLQRGAHVVLVGENRPRLYSAICAAQSLGAVAVPLYPEATADELAVLLQIAEPTHVFAENQEQVDKLLAIQPRCPSIQCIVYDQDRGMRHYKQPLLASYADLLEEGRKLDPSQREQVRAEAGHGRAEDPAFLFFTSGTTGPSKGVVLTHGSLIDRARVIVTAEGMSDTDIAIAYLPPGWIGQSQFGYVQPMVAGYCVCCPESSETLLSDMREVGPTCFLATPRVLEALLTQVVMRMEDTGGLNYALYRRLMASAQRIVSRRLAGLSVGPGDRLTEMLGDVLIYGPLRDVMGMSRIRTAYSAGDAIAPGVLLFFRALGINLKQLYGSTETGFFVAMQRDGGVKPDTAGPVTDGVEISFSPEREILVRTPGLFREYHRDPEATTRSRNAEGWFRTGDAGYLGDDGHLRIIDRMINVGALADGRPYAPKPIENRLKILPAVREAVAFGAGRDRVCVLIDIDVSVVGRWADRRGIPYTGRADLAALDEVHSLIGDGIAQINAELAADPALSGAQIARYVVLLRELNANDGMLTRTGKLRRSEIARRYGAVLEALYGSRGEVRIDADEGPVEIKIHDARVSGGAARRAA